MSSDMKDTVEALLLKKIKFIGEGEHTYLGTPAELIDDLSDLIKRETDRAVMGELQDMLDGYKLSLKDEPTGTVDVFAPILHALDHRIAQLKQQQSTGGKG